MDREKKDIWIEKKKDVIERDKIFIYIATFY